MSCNVLPLILSSIDANNNVKIETPESNPDPPLQQHPLVIHFDINETILIGDEAGGDAREDVINKMLAKSAFVQIPSDISNEKDTLTCEPCCWWDGTPLQESYEATDSAGTSKPPPPPPPLYTGWEWPANSCPYYRTAFKRRAKTFVEHHGCIYRKMHDLIEQQLHFVSPPDLIHFHHPNPTALTHVIPAIFETLAELTRRKTKHRIVFRTFGTDLYDVAAVMTAFATGEHPRYQDFLNQDYILKPTQLFKGNWVLDGESESSNDYIYQLSQNGEVCALGDAEVLRVIEQHTVCGIQDDYEFWSAHGFEPWAGKPVWMLDEAHHVLLDDNIHNLVHYSIAGVRKRLPDGRFETLNGQETRQKHGVHLIRVPTIEPVLNPDWFLTQIDQAVQNIYVEGRGLNITKSNGHNDRQL